MSNLRDIYAAIAATTITAGGVAVPCRALAETLETVESAHMPTRQIQPFGGKGDGRLESFYTFAQGVQSFTWGIVDMLFYRAAEAGIGLSDISPILVEYLENYPEMLRSTLRTSKYNVTGCVITVEQFEWPAGSGRFYDGATAQLSIREIIP